MTTQYADIPLSFKPHPITGDIGRVTDEAAVKQAIKMLVLTNRYERVFEPTIGGNVVSHLFSLGTPAHAMLLKADIETCLRNSEVRALIHRVDVIPDLDGHAYSVNITFQTQQMLNPETVSFNLERIR